MSSQITPIPSTFAPTIAGMGRTFDFYGASNDTLAGTPTEVQEVSTTSATAEVGVFQRVYANSGIITLTGGISNVVGTQTSITQTSPGVFTFPDSPPYGSYVINNGATLTGLQWSANWTIANLPTIVQPWLDVPITIMTATALAHTVTLPSVGASGIFWDASHHVATMTHATIGDSFTFKFVKAGTTAAPIYYAVILSNNAGLTFS